MKFEQITQEKTKNESSFEEERNIWDKKRSKYRTTWQKLFGDKEKDDMNLIIDEALEMDKKIDELLSNEGVKSREDAIEKIGEREQHGLHNHVSKADYVKLRTLFFSRALEDNRFDKAIIASYWSTTEKRLRNAIAPLIAEKAAELVKNKDGKNLFEAFRTYGMTEYLNIEKLPKEELQQPEIQDALNKILIHMAKGNVNFFFQYRESWIKAGIIDAKKTNESPLIREKIKEEIIRSTYNPYAFKKTKKIWVDAGIVTEDEINNWPEIKAYTKK